MWGTHFYQLRGRMKCDLIFLDGVIAHNFSIHCFIIFNLAILPGMISSLVIFFFVVFYLPTGYCPPNTRFSFRFIPIFRYAEETTTTNRNTTKHKKKRKEKRWSEYRKISQCYLYKYYTLSAILKPIRRIPLSTVSVIFGVIICWLHESMILLFSLRLPRIHSTCDAIRFWIPPCACYLGPTN